MPAGQSKQYDSESLPVSAENLPRTQFWHVAEGAAARRVGYEPGARWSQALSSSALVIDEYVPVGQLTQKLTPVEAEYLPLSQSLQS